MECRHGGIRGPVPRSLDMYRQSAGVLWARSITRYFEVVAVMGRRKEKQPKRSLTEEGIKKM